MAPRKRDKFVLVLLIVTVLFGIALAAVSFHYHKLITEAEIFVDVQASCYYSEGMSGALENFCLHSQLWKTSATIGVVFGCLDVCFGLITVLITYRYLFKPERKTTWQNQRKRNEDKSYIAHDTQIVWLGYQLISKLLFSYIYIALRDSKATTVPEIEARSDHLELNALVFTIFCGLELASVVLGVLFAGYMGVVYLYNELYEYDR